VGDNFIVEFFIGVAGAIIGAGATIALTFIYDNYKKREIHIM